MILVQQPLGRNARLLQVQVQFVKLCIRQDSLGHRI